ncbi:MAG TPA: YkgJ family cysteine cluster protein [Methanocella sp.]|jgi:Fe-S-cluster containining protein
MIGRQDFFARARRRSSCYTTEQLYAAYETFLTCPKSPFREERDAAADCSRCGNCCRRNWRVEVSLQDVLRWATEGRHDIIESLEHMPRGHSPVAAGIPSVIRPLSLLLSGEEADYRAKVLEIARSLESGEGSYVLPKKTGCFYLIDGVTTACSIYDTRPEVCRIFPAIK